MKKFRNWQQVANKFILLTMFLQLFATPISALAETQVNKEPDVQTVVSEAKEEQEQAKITQETTTEATKEVPTNEKEQSTEKVLDEAAKGNDSPETSGSIQEIDGKSYFVPTQQGNLEDSFPNDKSVENKKEISDSSNSNDEKAKVPSNFEEVDWNNAEDILAALNNPEFPFVEEADVFNATSTTQQLELFNKTKAGYENRLTELSSRRKRSTSTLQPDLYGQGINWSVTNQSHAPQYTHDAINRFKLNGQIAFCLQSGVPAGFGKPYESAPISTYIKDKNIQRRIALISYFGYITNPDQSYEQYFAAQLMIWQTLGTELVSVYSGLNYDQRKQGIEAKIKEFEKRASFNGQTKTIKVGQEYRFKDTNNTLHLTKNIRADKGITARIDGNDLVIKVDSNANKNANVYLDKIKVQGSPLVYNYQNYQKLGVLHPDDPGTSLLKLDVLKEAPVKVKKVNEAGQGLAGAEFALFINNKEVERKTTDKNGNLEFAKKIEHGTKVRIQEMKAPHGYFIGENERSKEITVDATKENVVKFLNYAPKIQTTAKNKEDNTNVMFPTVKQTIVDTVKVKDIQEGKEYTVKGKLMDKATNKPLVVNGKEVTAERTYTANKKDVKDLVVDPKTKLISGSVDLAFTFDGTDLQGKEIVVFETLYQDGKEIGVHADINDKAQTVTVPTPDLKTTAFNKIDTTSYFQALPEQEVVDTVEVSQLKVGKEYTVEGKLMDKTTGKAFLDAAGKEVTGSTTFIANKDTVKEFKLDEKSQLISGKVDVIFHVDFSKAEGKDIVVFEDLFTDKVKIATHADLEDKNQTITVLTPDVKTTLFNQLDQSKVANGTKEITLEDVVTFKDVKVGKEYTVKGKLMDKATNAPFIDVDGKEVVSEVSFVAEKDMEGATFDEKTGTLSGTVKVPFTFTVAEKTESTDLVAFEDLVHKDTTLAVHADIEDKDQTIQLFVPSLHTTATNQADGLKILDPLEKLNIQDVVAYKDLVKGRTYTLRGRLMDKDTGKELQVDGKAVEKTVTFVAGTNEVTEVKETAKSTEESKEKVETTKSEPAFRQLALEPTEQAADGEKDEEGNFIKVSGEVTMTFELDGRSLKGKELVVFEELTYNETEVASHEDIEDEGQTVAITEPKIGTTATINGEKEATSSKNMTITDKVAYTNLIKGKEYTVEGKLMDKATNKPFIVNGKEITAKKTFTATDSNGFVKLDFVFDGSGIKQSTEIVVFEDVYRDNILMATHADINDKDQTVTITPPVPPVPNKPHLPKTGEVNNVMLAVFGGIILVGVGYVFINKRKKSE